MELGPFAVGDVQGKIAGDLSPGIALIDGQPFLMTEVQPGRKAFYPLDGDDPYFQTHARLERRLTLPIRGRLEVVLGQPERFVSDTLKGGDASQWPHGWLLVTAKHGASLSVIAHEGDQRRFPYAVSLSNFEEFAATNLGDHAIWFRNWQLHAVTASGDRFQIPLAAPSDVPSAGA